MEVRPPNPIPGFSLVSEDFIRGYESGCEDGRRMQSIELQEYRERDRLDTIHQQILEHFSSEETLPLNYRFVTYTLSPEYQCKITAEMFIERISKMMLSSNGPFNWYGSIEHTKEGVLHAHVLMCFAHVPKTGLSHAHFKRMGYKWGFIHVTNPNPKVPLVPQVHNFVKYIEKENFKVFGEKKFPHLKNEEITHTSRRAKEQGSSSHLQILQQDQTKETT